MKKFLFFVLFASSIFCSLGQVCLNKSAFDVRADSVWQGIDLPQAFSGKGVIIGVTDWGFDYTHPMFYDTSMTHYRVLRAWDQFKTSGPAPAGYSYGTEYIGQEQLLNARCDTANQYDYGYHGTHCAGIAGGAGAGTVYRGISYDADLLFATLYLDSVSSVIDAWDWMYQVAQSEGKRLVISGSWGLYCMDNMDGTGLLAEAMQRLYDLGVVFIVSAGNDGDVNFHIKHTFEGDGDTLRSQFKMPYDNGYLWGSSLSMMSSANSSFNFSLEVMNSNMEIIASTPFIPTAGNDGYVDTFLVVNNDTIIYNYEIESCNPYNQSPKVRLRVQRNSLYKYCLAVTSNAGTFHAWNVAELTKAWGNWGGDFVAPAQHPDWVSGDPEYGVGTPANIDCAISVAAHSKQFINPAGILVGGQIADFSSYGPGFHEGVMKPEISAPGVDITSSISSYTTDFPEHDYKKKVTFNGRTYGFGAISGTSMACPFVSGVAALVLQANPYLTAAQVKEILINTAYNDQNTAASGTIRFGYGKVDAYQAVKEALRLVGVEENIQLETRYNVFPNPVSENCYITAQTNSENIPCYLYDISGRMLRSEILHSGVNTMSFNNLPAGCYFLKILDNNQIVTKKIILQ